MRTSSVAVVVGILVAGIAQAQDAGQVMALTGEVSIVREGRVLRPAAQSAVRPGDVVRTGAASSVQLKLQDSTVLALRPDTALRIDEWRKDESGEHAALTLLRGGVRAIAGALAEKTPASYRLSTPLVTLGMRGKAFSALVCQANCPNLKDGIYGGALEGRLAVVNDANAEREFGAGEFFFVQDSRTAPERLLTPPAFLRERL